MLRSDMNRFTRSVTLGLVAYVALAACSPAVRPIASEPNVVGIVSEVVAVEHAETIGQLLVEAPGDKTSDKYVVAVRPDTLIFEQVEEDYRQLAFETLRAGHKVQLWFSGAVRESYPAHHRYALAIADGPDAHSYGDGEPQADCHRTSQPDIDGHRGRLLPYPNSGTVCIPGRGAGGR
ncbi:MAG: hypothetical protein AMJ93_14360 [Anaerolineae bacterium SM23_84]|nr:MAG: hypothetical protein AMJ93_14360 [Anaerolineae bacterium SM23_84]